MKHFKTQLGRFLIMSLGFFLAFPPTALAHNAYSGTFTSNRPVAQYQQGSFSPEEINSLNYVYRREQLSIEYYTSVTNALGEEEKLLFQKVKQENEMHINALQDFYQNHSLSAPAPSAERDPFYTERVERSKNLQESLRAGIELEQREIAELSRQIESVTDYQLKNFLSYLRIESYLHLCEMFVFSELKEVPVAIDPRDAESCRSIMALEKIPEQERSVPQPQSFHESGLVADTSGVLLAQGIYQQGNTLDYGSFYEGFGYRYLTPTPFYGYGNYGGYGGYGGYPYGGYPGGYPGYPTGGYPGIPRTPYFPGYPYSGGRGGNHYDFNFYFHNPYDSGFNYGSYPFPGYGY